MAQIQRPWWDVVNPVAWGQDLASSAGIHGDNDYDPVVQARKASAAGDIDTLEEITKNYTPGNFNDQAEQRQWEKQIAEGRVKQQDDAEKKATEKLYGKTPNGKGVIENLEERRAAMDAAARRQQFEHETGMNTQNIQGQKDIAQIQSGSNEKIADLTSGRQLEGIGIQTQSNERVAGMQTRSNENITRMQTGSNERITGMQTGSNERIADMTSARQLQGIGVQTQSQERIAGMQDRTNRDLGFGDLKRRRAEALLNTYGQNKAGIQNFIVGAGQRSSFR